ncbi:homeodomain transcription factor [Amanita muscaria]
MESAIDSLPQSSSPTGSPPDTTKPLSQKKPRHRHTPAQLAALNELFEKSEHPALEQRISLAERLGMETKTVNAWFQNKRASSKKRSRNHKYNDIHSTCTPSAPSSTSRLPNLTENDDYHDDEISSVDMNQTHLVPDLALPYHRSANHSGNGDAPQFISEAESLPRRTRTHSTDELKRMYGNDPHPSTELREVLSQRLGMQYQTITNWFQNHHSPSRKKHEQLDVDASLNSDYAFEDHYMGYPSGQSHPSQSSALKNAAQYHGMGNSVDYSLHMEEATYRRISSKRYSTPYSTASTFSRPRRSRPEPYQLDALKELFTKTPTPSIEERSALAAEIGMDLGRVTNWFRNLRQTARKRAKKTGSSEDDDEFASLREHSGSFSRPATPSQHSTSSANDDGMELDDDHYLHHSDVGSDEEYQEAITPSPEPLTHSKSDLSSYPGLDKLSLTQYHGVKIEDALLLLSFHQHVMQ